MEQAVLPLPLARLAMVVAPPLLLQRMVDILVHKMEQRHPRLFKNLMRLPAATILIEPTDLPHRFLLCMGASGISLKVIDGEAPPTDAHIKGSLATLLDMLEGRSDGDTLFFSRALVISGDTSVIVGLRNTLDREEIRLIDDVSSLGGPFEKPVSVGLVLMGRLAHRLKQHISHLHDHLHDDEKNTMRAEIAALRARLAELEKERASAKGAA